MILFATSARSALAALGPVEFGLAATRATIQLLIAMVLGLVSLTMVWRPDARPARVVAGIVIGSVWPFLGLRFLGWPGVAAGFALTIVTLAVGCRPGAPTRTADRA
jgi:hypothetical protein